MQTQHCAWIPVQSVMEVLNHRAIAGTVVQVEGYRM